MCVERTVAAKMDTPLAAFRIRSRDCRHVYPAGEGEIESASDGDIYRCVACRALLPQLICTSGALIQPGRHEDRPREAGRKRKANGGRSKITRRQKRVTEVAALSNTGGEEVMGTKEACDDVLSRLDVELDTGNDDRDEVKSEPEVDSNDDYWIADSCDIVPVDDTKAKKAKRGLRQRIGKKESCNQRF